MSHDNSNDASDPQVSFARGQLVNRAADGTEYTVPVLLRNGGLSRVGAVYLGQQAPPTGGELRLVDADGVSEEVRLVCTRQPAEYVFLLGLEPADEQPG